MPVKDIQIVRNLCELAVEANALLGKLGTKDHPVEPHYAKEFYKLEMRMISLSELVEEYRDKK